MGKATIGASHLSSDTIMEQMRREAQADTTGKRMATLDRLEAACHAITSGDAFHLAKKNHHDTKRFRPSRSRFVPEDVYEYVKLRRKVEGFKNDWVGPTADFIRADPGLLAYVRAVEAERFPARKARRSTASSQLDEIIDEIQSASDRGLVRQALEFGSQAQKLLNKSRQILKKIARIDLDLIDASMSVEQILEQASGKIAPAKEAAIRRLLSRLTDRVELGVMGLEYRAGGVKSFGTGEELVSPEEMQVLASLCEFRLPS